MPFLPPPSDWFIAHSNYWKDEIHSANGYDFTAISKSRGRGDSATQPKTVQMLLCRQLHFLPFLQKSHVVSFTSQQPSLQKLVPKCQKIPTERGSKSASPGQSCRMSIFSHPVQISQYGTILHLWCSSYPQQQITRIMVNEKKKTTNETEKDTRVLTNVYFLSNHSLKLLSNSIKKKDKIEVFQ